MVSAELASAAWTVTATAQRAGLNPLAYLTAYLDACAQAGGKAPTGEALGAFLPWAASDHDLADRRRSGRTGPEDTGTEGTGTEGTGPGPDRCTGPAP